MESKEDIHRKIRETKDRHWDDWEFATELTKMIEEWQGEAYDEGYDEGKMNGRREDW